MPVGQGGGVGAMPPFCQMPNAAPDTISLRIFHSRCIHTVKGFNTVSKAEVNVFLELSCFFNDPMDVGNLISGSFAISKPSLNIWKFMLHLLLKPGWIILSITLLACEMSAIMR